MNKLLIFLLTGIVSSGYSQSPRMSRYELCWALFHPVAAIKVKTITKQNSKFVDIKKVIVELDSFSNGGKADALRHVFYMSTYTQKIRANKVRKLGIAHEKNNRLQFKRSTLEYGETPDSLSSVMDLKNNELGIALGCNNRQLSKQELYALVVAEIKKGKALIMKRNKKGEFVTCADEVIDLNKFRKSWNVPKCLVASDMN